MHAHIYTYERDCDGQHQHEELFTKDSLIKSDISDYMFRAYVIGSHCDIFEGEMNVNRNGDEVTIFGRTDEGAKTHAIEFCDDEGCLPLTHEQKFEQMLNEYSVMEDTYGKYDSDDWA